MVTAKSPLPHEVAGRSSAPVVDHCVPLSQTNFLRGLSYGTEERDEVRRQ
jgi:hypothetical protein